MSAVLITVRGGVAEYYISGNVEVDILDFDDMATDDALPVLSGDLLTLARQFLTEGEDFTA